MSKRVHPYDLAATIATSMIDYQDILIANRDRGRAEEQSIEPTLTLTFKEIAKQLKRERFHSDVMVGHLKNHLEDWGLVVEEVGQSLIITKPAEDLEVEFTSLKALKQAVLASQEASEVA